MYDENKIIFRYELKDAFERELKSVIITDDNKLHLDTELLTEIERPIEVDNINKIIKKYSNKINEITDRSLPVLPMLDGYINTIDYKEDNKLNNLRISCLDYYSIEDIKGNKYLSTIFDYLKEIYDELSKQEPEVEKYFIFSEDEEA